MTKKVHRLKAVKLEKILEIVNNLKDKAEEIEIVFEESKEFKREKDEFIHSITELLKHYFSTDTFIDEPDLKECIFNAGERFMEHVELLTPLKKALEQLEHWKLKKIDVRKPEEERFGAMIVSAVFENKGYYIYMNMYVNPENPLELQIEFVVPKEIFKKMTDNPFFEIVEVEKGYEEYEALRTTCKKLLADKLYWKGLL